MKMFRKKPFCLQDANREMEAAGVGGQATISYDVIEDEIQASFYSAAFEPEAHHFSTKLGKGLQKVARNRELKIKVRRTPIESSRVPPFIIVSDLFERYLDACSSTGRASQIGVQELKGEKKISHKVKKELHEELSPWTSTTGRRYKSAQSARAHSFFKKKEGVLESSPSQNTVQDQQELAKTFAQIYRVIKDDRRKDHNEPELLHTYNNDFPEEDLTKEPFRNFVSDISPSTSSLHKGSKKFRTQEVQSGTQNDSNTSKH